MIFESWAQVEGTSAAQKGARHKLGTSRAFGLCPSKSLFSFVFLTKRQKAQVKEGGHYKMQKQVKKGQKEGKRGENINIQRNRKHLCLVPSSNPMALHGLDDHKGKGYICGHISTWSAAWKSKKTSPSRQTPEAGLFGEINIRFQKWKSETASLSLAKLPAAIMPKLFGPRECGAQGKSHLASFFHEPKMAVFGFGEQSNVVAGRVIL